MKKIIFMLFVLFVISCQTDDKIIKEDEFSTKDLAEAIAEGVFDSDFNTKILKKDFFLSVNQEKLKGITDEIVEEMYEMSSSISYNVLFYYNSNDELMIKSSQKEIKASINGELELREMDCKDYEKCKKCRSKDCVSKFMNDAVDEYGGCAEFKVDKHRFSADVYARPCKKDEN